VSPRAPADGGLDAHDARARHVLRNEAHLRRAEVPDQVVDEEGEAADVHRAGDETRPTPEHGAAVDGDRALRLE